MRILFVNKFGFLRGGVERVVLDEIDWLREAGHDAELFATRHPENLEWHYSDWFPPYAEIGVNGRFSPGAVKSMFWNEIAKKALEDVIDEFRPDVVHFHGIHRHLSPSVLAAARAKKIPTVMTLHDYWPICPGNVLLRSGVTPCIPHACSGTFWPAIEHRCVQDSAARSALAAAELAWQRARRRYEEGLDALISPSVFLKNQMMEAGFSNARFEVIPNAVRDNAPHFASRSSETPILLYAGRLSPEKGIGVLVSAAERSGTRLIVAGTGPEQPTVERSAIVDYRGVLDSEQLLDARTQTVAAVVPSLTYENTPLAVIESMICGRPVIGSAVAGIAEVMRDGVDGILVTPGSVDELADAMSALAGSPSVAARLGANARARALECYSSSAHLAALLRLYQDLAAA